MDRDLFVSEKRFLHSVQVLCFFLHSVQVLCHYDCEVQRMFVAAYLMMIRL